MSSDDEHMPDLATNEEWRGIMERARKAKGLSQADLGDRVGLSQVMISKLETGESKSSTYVLRICRELDIPEPANFATEEQREWWQLGHVLRARSEDQYKAAVRLLKTMVEQFDTQGVTEKDQPPNLPGTRRKP